MGLRLYGAPAGENLGAVQLSIGANTASATVTSHQQPATVTGLPRINSGQADGDTLTIDAGGLTLTGYQWQELDGSWADISGATSATYDTTGNMHMGKWLRCVTPQGTTPAIHIYMQMAMASHNKDDVDLLALFPHDDATHIAIASGGWDTPATWLDGRVPRWGARVLIAQGVVVTYDHDAFDRLDWVRIDGTLNWELDQDTKILCETIFVSRGGQMNCGTPGNRLPAQYTAEFMVSNRYYRGESMASTELGGGTLDNDPTLVSRGIMSQGSRVMWGADKVSWLRTRCTFELATTLNGATETTVVLTENIPTTLAASGVFQVIDDDGEYIDLTYTSYSGATLTITSADFSTVNATAGNASYISFAPQAGDTQLTLAKAATGWAIGDTLVIGGTKPTVSLAQSETEEVTITAVVGDVVTFTPALAYTHDHKNPNVTRADLQPGVGNITRNIKIYTEDGRRVPTYKRGHTMDMHMPCHQDLWQVEHFDLGRTVKTMDGPFSGKIDPDNSAQLKVPNSGGFDFIPLTTQSNVQSRYAVHGHIVGRLKAKRDTTSGCTVRNAAGWGIAHHGGEQNINNCVVHEFAGAGIVSEQGDELGEWVNNLCMKSTNRIQNNAKVLQAGAGGRGDDSRHGYAFSSRGRAFRSAENFAMDCSAGHVYVHRQGESITLGVDTPSGASITPNINIPSDALDFGDLRGAGGGSDIILHHQFPIIHNNFAEAAGVLQTGLYVTKEDPQQNHGLAVNFIKPKVWATANIGVDLEYVAHYIVTDADCVAAVDGVGPGILFSQNTHQMSAIRPRVEGFKTGISAGGGIIPTTPRFNAISQYDITTDPLHIVQGTKAIRCTNAENLNALAVSSPTVSATVEPSTNLPFKLGDLINGTSDIQNPVTGTFTDSFNSAGQLPRPNDSLGMPFGAGDNWGAFIQPYLAVLGGYDLVDGVRFVVFPMYFTDRITGVPIRSIHGYQLPSGLGYSQRRAWTPAANTITINSGDPVQFNVAANGSQTIDIMALVSDTAGATLYFAVNPHNTSKLTHWNPDHGRLEWDGADSVTYTPDLGYTGPDRGWMWVEDDIGNCKRVDLEMTVT